MTAIGIPFLVSLALWLPVVGVAQPAATPAPFSPAVVAGDFVYLSGMLPTDASGKVVAGDARVQTARALDNLGALLEKNDSSLAQVAALTVYLRHASDFAAMNEVSATYWPKDPPTRATVVGRLVAPDALVEISMIAVRSGRERKVVHPSAWLKPTNPYNYGIQSGDTLFLAGLVARNPRDNSIVPGDMQAQTRTIVGCATEILGAAGMTLADVVSSRVFITDIALLQDMNSVYRTAFPTSPPARATVKAGLTAPQYLVEIVMVAVKGGPRDAITTPNADGTPGTANPVLSSAIRVGDRLFLSGMLGNTPATKNDVLAQTRETIARLGRTLRSAGFRWADVVDAVVYLPEMANAGAMTAAYREVFAEAFPAGTTVEAELVSPDARVEIMMTAVKPPAPPGAGGAKTVSAGSGDWRPMFDGKTLTGWKEGQFTARGKVSVEDGQVVLGNGYITGITWTGAFPTSNYEVRYQAQRRSGSDFFGALTFPVHDSYCTFVNGGWGGSVVGLSSLDSMDASENDTTLTMGFTNGRWYSFRVRVTDGSIEAWIDDERVVAVDIRGRRIGLRPGDIEYSAPLGIASYESVAAIRNIEYRVFNPADDTKR
jgi:enamine deaminase RidA (YjgF/YER057c/UK114 family)